MNINELEEAIKKFPLSLLAIKDKETLEIIDSYLPFSVGIEIECDNKKSFNEQIFKNIPNIIEVNCSSNEKRFRIPNGLKGMVCLFEITKLLKKECLLNPLSGIHYHIDMTDVFHFIDTTIIENNKNYILEELDTWEYKGTYNKRDVKLNVRCWVRFDSYKKTCEFRIGEMTFDYELIFKRILHCTDIIKKFRKLIKGNEYDLKLMKLKRELDNIKIKETEIQPLIIQNRVIDLKNYGR